jgi:TIGR03009 family protein
MKSTARPLLLGLLAGLCLESFLLAQQGAVAPLPAAQAPQVPPQFQLNPIEQALLNQVLATWENQSAKVATFRCPFERWEYNAAFGPGADIPLNKDKGELSYQKPDKGSFQITEVRKWQAEPVPPGEEPSAQAKGDWVAQPNAIGEHWVCNGEAVFEYRQEQKQLVERPIPKEMRGQAIVDGPLPFLFGAEANKLKQRYWMRIEQQPNDNQIWLTAQPKFQADAANYQAVRLILDRQQLLPEAMEVLLPDQSRHVYLFDLKNAAVNGTFDRIQALFTRPRTPLGWQRVVEDAPAEPPAANAPLRQAAQPDDAPR